jgi:serine/threonine protein kinase
MNTTQQIHVFENRASPTGFAGLPVGWELTLVSNGITKDEIRANPSAASDLFFYINRTNLNILPAEQKIRKSDLKISKRNPHKTYAFQDIIGRGFTCTVFLATLIVDTARKYAIKEILQSRDKHETYKEISILQRSHHPNIIHLIEAYCHKKRHYMVMELA